MLAIADLLAAWVGTSFLVAVHPAASPLIPIALLVIWPVMAKLFGLYDRDQMVIRHLTADEVPGVAAWAGAAAVTEALILSYSIPIGYITVVELILLWATVTGFALLLRGGARAIWRRVTPPEATVVVGEGELAAAARRKVHLFPDMHLNLVDEPDLPAAPGADESTLARLRDLAQGVDRVIIAGEAIDAKLISAFVAICRDEQVKLSVVSPLRGRAGAVPRLSEVADLPVLEYDTRDVSRSTMIIKRVFDVAVSGAALIVLAPVLALIALPIRLESRGPVLFVQVRAGMNGRPYRMIKFRTMYRDAESALPEMVRFDALEDPMFKLKQDPRVTRTGRFLRRFSLDELPQLINVLRGEMSVVGPRPEQMELVERYRPEHHFRLAVKPGVTGPMQVFGRGELTFAERLAVELDYIEHMSLARDFRIILQTLPMVVRGYGAY